MKNQETFNIDLSSRKQCNLFLYQKYFDLFVKLFDNNLLPNNILLSGQSGIGKSTFAYHFINFFLSKNEVYSYDYNNFTINPLNKSFRLVNQKCHPNFYLIENFANKQTIDVNQIRVMINYATKTTYGNEIKFILIDNAEYLNLSSVNALLKIVEESPSKTFFIFIHNTATKLSETIKSRCIEFKIFFTNKEKKYALNNICTSHGLNFDEKLLEEIKGFYDSPGTILSYIKFIEEGVIDEKKIELTNVIFNLIELNLKNKSNENLNLLQNCIELFFFKKIKKNNNKNRILFNYSEVIKQLNLFRKYNIDKNNTFYEIKENIMYG